jgi:hypothetical protein
MYSWQGLRRLVPLAATLGFMGGTIAYQGMADDRDVPHLTVMANGSVAMGGVSLLPDTADPARRAEVERGLRFLAENATLPPTTVFIENPRQAFARAAGVGISLSLLTFVLAPIAVHIRTRQGR